MEYDFSIPTDRRGTDSYKWDSAPEADIIPLWVADMDFETFPAITEALQRRVAHGIFGYTRVPEAYYEAVCRWFKKRHGWHINREDIAQLYIIHPKKTAQRFFDKVQSLFSTHPSTAERIRILEQF